VAFSATFTDTPPGTVVVVDGTVVDGVVDVVDVVLVVVVGVVVVVVGAAVVLVVEVVVVPPVAVQVWISARPMFQVELDTAVMVSRTLVVARALKLTVVAEPALFRVPRFTVLPSENVRVAAVIWSEVLGRS
jgi:hypothetical protein